MAESGNSTLQSILLNLRKAAIDFAEPFADPAQVKPQLIKLLAELGINDPMPGNKVSSALERVASGWADIGKKLGGQLDLLNPVGTATHLLAIGKQLQEQIVALTHLPEEVAAALLEAGREIAEVLPQRLLHYILYEFITKSHPKIGGAFLLLGILRRKSAKASASGALIDAQLRHFDIGQMVKVISDPRAAMLEALKWGSDEFDSQTVVDGISLLLGVLSDAGVVLGPDKDTFPAADESAFVGRSVAAVDALRPISAQRIVSAPLPLPAPPGTVAKLSLVGLHRDGLGLMVDIPFTAKGGLGMLKIPKPPAGAILALSAGDPPATADPRVRVLPKAPTP